MPGTKRAEGWVLTLDLASKGRLTAALSDSHWSFEFAEGPWPPESDLALPPAMTQAVGRIDGAPLRLQLRTALDPWPWEREVGSACGSIVARYLVDLPPPADPTPLLTPLVAERPQGEAHFALVQAARAHQRPLVLLDPEVAADGRVALERSLRSHWKDPLMLSQALATSLAQVGLPPTLCRLYGDGRAQPAGTEQGWRPVTALSIDLVGSTQLMQTLGAESYAQRLQAYHESCREVIHRFQGSLDTPQGDDGLMAYFGFPLAVEDAAKRALTAAWQLSGGMAGLGLQVRIGVASGQLAVSAQQAFGPEVHLAARLCGAALPGQILVAPSTRDRVGPGFVLEPLDKALALKDFGSQKSIHLLSGLQPAVGGRAPRPGGICAFVGRRRELDRLRAAWVAACGERLQWCAVHGEAGIGKTRLLQQFASELQTQGERCMQITGQVQWRSSPFAALVDALRSHWTIEPDVGVGQLRQRLAELLPQLLSEAEDHEHLARLLAQGRSDPPTHDSGRQRRGGELLLDCLRALAAGAPLCLLVDDAHWLDPSSTELLRRLRAVGANLALLVVLAERTEPSRALTFAGGDPIVLPGLADDEAREMARQLGADLPEQVCRRIVELAAGVPLFLEESLQMRSHRDAGALGDVPARLEDLLMVRLDELGSDRALAQLVSVLGRNCSAVHLDALLEQDDPFVARARQQGSLGSLLDSGLLQTLDGPVPGYRFKHALIRDVAYASIWTDDRTRLHGLCADLLERAAPELARQRPELLAHHQESAGRLAPAWLSWVAAAQLAAARQAHQETLDLTQRAFALQGQLPDDAGHARQAMQLHLLVASAQIALHGYGSEQVEAAYLAAERVGAQLADSAHALRIRLGLEACYVMRGDLRRAAELATAGVAATAWDSDARLALQTRWALANVRFHQGDWRAALTGFDDCLAHYGRELHRRSSVQDPAIMCLGYSSWVHFELGQADEALLRIDRMLELAAELQHPFSTAVALGFAASLKRLCGDPEGAWPHAIEAVRVCERGGFQVWLAHGWMVRGQLRCDRGDHSGGDDDMDRGYRLWVGGGARISCATYLVTRAELLLRQRLTTKAGADMDRAWQISEQIGEHYYQAELLRVRALCAWQAGDQSQAQALLNQALKLAQQQGKPGLVLRCTLSLGALQAAQGRTQAAAEPLRRLLAELPRHGHSRDARWARQALASWESGHAFDAAEHTPWEPQ